jgi:phosphate transport system permease protein
MTEPMLQLPNVSKRLVKRHKAEKRFQFMALASVLLGLIFLAVLFINVLTTGADAILQTKVRLDINLQISDFGGSRNPDVQQLNNANYQSIIKRTVYKVFPEVKSRRDKRELYRLVSSGAAYELKEFIIDNPSNIGTYISIWLTASDDVDMIMKGKVSRTASSDVRRLSDQQMSWLEKLEAQGNLKTKFNWTLFSSGDSREPELAGVAAAMVGSFYSIIVCLVISFPLGVMAALYLESFAPKNWFTSFIEVNINNLAAVPSIVFGLLGLAVFLNFFELPRSAPLVGGMVLSLMTMPTIIIAGRVAIQGVPPSIKEAALAVGASPVQAVFHHVLPLAMPGVLTGTIIGTARALGETAPLLMIGMVAFIVDVPGSVLDPATALPVQVYLWSDMPEKGFAERTSATILVLLAFVGLMNLTAVFLRKKFEIRW